ncbi:MAG: PAS domain S-box protein [Rhodospirillaceae bacterium]|jgi:two-component system, NtrC family, nitrogen regulation sensor histidine kinase GlnL|nr:PAS domain S-box protein [Rhodospirillaceae bacterium]MBT3927550.1 PAS domain S-box protein [Rhodospirillaceae bacterium]MBT4426937.1 PAS domain S-box protein [Rhodospirillaceae bacterium]MBT5038699.1 PAS domain S-box protein [Rhodospirillaceae bacterium]MBT5677760.1 PAS domain S-box protein [Rhodospirillaceae bacterium]
MNTELLASDALERDAPSYSAEILDALPLAVMLVGEDGAIAHANPSAEELFGMSSAVLAKHDLARVAGPYNNLLALAQQVRLGGQTMFEYGVELELPRGAGSHLVDIRAAPLHHGANLVVLTLAHRTVAEQLSRRSQQRDSGRSNAAMAATLAHEVRNPLSGIRGAAQLLESGASEGDKALARMIRDESDRIGALIDRMEAFGGTIPEAKVALNIHELLDHVRTVAGSGFARQAEFKTIYDPSLPLIDGNRDALVQTFLNLFKNAAEALPARGGVISISTRYEHGLSVNSGGRLRVQLPIAIRIEDNGVGIAEDLHDCLFEPFVTNKSGGSGLGLALVAKTVADHGGVVDMETGQGRTMFRILLPAADGLLSDADRGRGAP